MQLDAEIRTILVPISPRPSLAAIPYAVSVARAMGARIVYLHVWDGRKPRDDMPRALTRLVEQTENVGVRSESHITAGPLVETVMGETARLQADMVVLTRTDWGERSERIEEGLLSLRRQLPILVVPEVLKVERVLSSQPPRKDNVRLDEVTVEVDIVDDELPESDLVEDELPEEEIVDEEEESTGKPAPPSTEETSEEDRTSAPHA